MRRCLALKAIYRGKNEENRIKTKIFPRNVCKFGKKPYLCIAFETRDIGRLAQLVQSICLTSRGSAVRIRQRPPQIKSQYFTAQNNMFGGICKAKSMCKHWLFLFYNKLLSQSCSKVKKMNYFCSLNNTYYNIYGFGFVDGYIAY